MGVARAVASFLRASDFHPSPLRPHLYVTLLPLLTLRSFLARKPSRHQRARNVSLRCATMFGASLVAAPAVPAAVVPVSAKKSNVRTRVGHERNAVRVWG
jgi:hypothetical protein